MSLINTYLFTKTLVYGEEMINSFGNEFVFVAARPYKDKKDALPNGFTATLQVLHDNNDYGVDKNGKPRDNNILQTFEVTVLDGSDGRKFKKGDHVKLIGYKPDVSYAIGFDLLLRFEKMELCNEGKK